MSYIHEALIKAQKERDSRYQEYGGFLEARRKGPGLVAGRAMGIAAVLLILILFAFAAYPWLNSDGSRHALQPLSAASEEGKQPEKGMGGDGTYDRARQFQKNGRLEDAGRLYEETLKRDPRHVDALNNLGVILMHERDYRRARSSFESAIRLDPENVDPYYNLACLCTIKGETRKGLIHLKKAISLDPSAREWARRDVDLLRLRNLPQFREMVEGAGVPEPDVGVIQELNR